VSSIIPPIGALSRRKFEWQVFVQGGIYGVIGRHKPDCVSVRRRAEHGSHADVAAGAGPVLDDELLTQFVRQKLADKSSYDVVWSAGCERHDEMHGPPWIGLRDCDPRTECQRPRTRRETEKCSPSNCHAALRKTVLAVVWSGTGAQSSGFT
jgi:hypothetical protein